MVKNFLNEIGILFNYCPESTGVLPCQTRLMDDVVSLSLSIGAWRQDPTQPNMTGIREGSMIVSRTLPPSVG
jgi:hypothetical protein